MALAWVVHQPYRFTPLFGARTVDQRREAFGALDVDAEEVAALMASPRL